ncbi:hypothetical protein B0O80DRAFT_508106 [Mortierella sp. GBAus27b]|nr:hypothetical protein B0O80DRAFT_508106 [Mortierella sp. GBAus27b]
MRANHAALWMVISVLTIAFTATASSDDWVDCWLSNTSDKHLEHNGKVHPDFQCLATRSIVGKRGTGGKQDKETKGLESAVTTGTTKAEEAAEAAAGGSKGDHHHPMTSTFRFHTLPISTFRKNGRIYMMTHQDWYTHYRRRRRPLAVVRKLVLENPHRRKARYTVLPTEEDDQDDEDDEDRDKSGDDNDNNGNNRRDSDRGGGATGDDDDERNGIHQCEGECEDKDGRQSIESIQSVKKRPKDSALPRPVSVKHTGLIPKARSGAGSHRDWSWTWSLCLAITLWCAYM